MGYFQVTIVAHGMVVDDEDFPDNFDGRQSYTRLLARRADQAINTRTRMDVYELYHGHDIVPEECTCIQYATDHKPQFVLGPEYPTYEEGVLSGPG